MFQFFLQQLAKNGVQLKKKLFKKIYLFLFFNDSEIFSHIYLMLIRCTSKSRILLSTYISKWLTNEKRESLNSYFSETTGILRLKELSKCNSFNNFIVVKLMFPTLMSEKWKWNNWNLLITTKSFFQKLFTCIYL